jgi:predicted Zn-dependent peptidase
VAATADGAAPAARATARAETLAEPRLTVLDSGVRIVTEAMPTVRSVTLGFWIGTGSVAETQSEGGLSHLVEHMLFRGTDRYGSLEIDQIFDTMGAELNAGTGKENTSVYARVIDDHLPQAFDVVGDMVWHPRIDDADLANEREIVLEEIAMYEDDPQDRVFDVLGEAVFGDHPLGRPVIGRADVIANTSAAGLRDFHARHYAPGDVVIAAAGSLDHDAVVELARGLDVPTRPRAPPSSTTSPSARPPSRATTTGASSCACSTTSSAARRRHGCSRRFASCAGWPTTSTPSSRCTRTPA